MRELEADFLSIELSEVYAIEKMSSSKTKIYIGNASFTLPAPYASIKQLVDMAKRGSSPNIHTG